jgi:hypothetical protein
VGCVKERKQESKLRKLNLLEPALEVTNPVMCEQELISWRKALISLNDLVAFQRKCPLPTPPPCEPSFNTSLRWEQITGKP